MTHLSPAKQAAAKGIKSLQSVADRTGVSRHTLSNWSESRPQLFGVVLDGCLAQERAETVIDAPQRKVKVSNRNKELGFVIAVVHTGPMSYEVECDGWAWFNRTFDSMGPAFSYLNKMVVISKREMFERMYYSL